MTTAHKEPHKREGLLKNAFFPLWTRVPGTPFSIQGNLDPSERLPGMDTWTPRERMERVSAGMHAGVPIETMMQAEGDKDKLRNVLTSAGAGALGGGLLGRLYGGAEATAPIREMISGGVHPSEIMKQLAKLPTPMKALIAAGGLGGAYYGASRWADKRPERMHQTYETARAIRNDQLLNDVNIMKARDYLQQKAQEQPSILNVHPSRTQTSSSKEAIPHIVSSGRE